MFDKDDRDLTQTIARMQLESLDRCRFDQPAAAERMRSWIRNDRRLDGYDPDRIIENAAKARQCGGTFNLDDCRKGAPNRDAWKNPSRSGF